MSRLEKIIGGKSQEIAVEFAQGHGMYDQVLYGEIKKACGNFSDEAVKNAECEKLLDGLSKEEQEKAGEQGSKHLEAQREAH